MLVRTRRGTSTCSSPAKVEKRMHGLRDRRTRTSRPECIFSAFAPISRRCWQPPMFSSIRRATKRMGWACMKPSVKAFRPLSAPARASPSATRRISPDRLCPIRRGRNAGHHAEGLEERTRRPGSSARPRSHAASRRGPGTTWPPRSSRLSNDRRLVRRCSPLLDLRLAEPRRRCTMHLRPVCVCDAGSRPGGVLGTSVSIVRCTECGFAQPDRMPALAGVFRSDVRPALVGGLDRPTSITRSTRT